MWPFSKKWKPPPPQLGMVVSLANEEIPSLMMLANPAGAQGAVQGMAGPADGKPTPENMIRPMQEGQYVAISPAGGGCGLRVERPDRQAQGLSFPPETLPTAGLTPETLAKFNRPAWRVIIQMEAPARDNVQETVIFATRLAQRLAALGDGIVMDASAYRFFGPSGWPVENPLAEFDAREHVHIHIESDQRWFHTHGLIKFGRPEMEIYDVPSELDDSAFITLLDISQYLVTSDAIIAPGQTCGDPSQPFYARAASKNPDHWNNLPVLELVDLDERQKPVPSGAPKALSKAAGSGANAS